MTGPDTDEPLPLEGLSSMCDALDELLSSGRRTVRILAPNLDPALLNRRQVSANLAQFVRVSPNSRIRVLFADGADAARQGHQLVSSSRRFPSYMSIRRLPEEHRDIRNSWVLVDDLSLLWRRDFSRLENAWINWRDLRTAPKLCRDFDDWWELSQPDPEFRQLHL